jgi:hypothetical protein
MCVAIGTLYLDLFVRTYVCLRLAFSSIWVVCTLYLPYYWSDHGNQLHITELGTLSKGYTYYDKPVKYLFASSRQNAKCPK